MQRLLAPDGCPWDREQSFETLRKYVLEEACEVIDAIDSRRPRGASARSSATCSSRSSSRPSSAGAEGAFAIDDVVAGHRREARAPPPARLRRPRREGRRRGPPQLGEDQGAGEEGERGILGGVPAQPARADARPAHRREGRARRLRLARRARARAPRSPRSSAELDQRHRAAATPTAIEDEMGDVLFALVNLSRHVKVDAEGALRRTIDKFTQPLRPRRDAGEGGARRLGRRRGREPRRSRCSTVLGRGEGGREGRREALRSSRGAPSKPTRARCRSPASRRSGRRRSCASAAGRSTASRSSSGSTRAA